MIGFNRHLLPIKTKCNFSDSSVTGGYRDRWALGTKRATKHSPVVVSGWCESQRAYVGETLA